LTRFGAWLDVALSLNYETIKSNYLIDVNGALKSGLWLINNAADTGTYNITKTVANGSIIFYSSVERKIYWADSTTTTLASTDRVRVLLADPSGTAANLYQDRSDVSVGDATVSNGAVLELNFDNLSAFTIFGSETALHFVVIDENGYWFLTALSDRENPDARLPVLQSKVTSVGFSQTPIVVENRCTKTLDEWIINGVTVFSLDPATISYDEEGSYYPGVTLPTTETAWMDRRIGDKWLRSVATNPNRAISAGAYRYLHGFELTEADCPVTDPITTRIIDRLAVSTSSLVSGAIVESRHFEDYFFALQEWNYHSDIGSAHDSFERLSNPDRNTGRYVVAFPSWEDRTLLNRRKSYGLNLRLVEFMRCQIRQDRTIIPDNPYGQKQGLVLNPEGGCLWRDFDVEPNDRTRLVGNEIDYPVTASNPEGDPVDGAGPGDFSIDQDDGACEIASCERLSDDYVHFRVHGLFEQNLGRREELKAKLEKYVSGPPIRIEARQEQPFDPDLYVQRGV